MKIGWSKVVIVLSKTIFYLISYIVICYRQMKRNRNLRRWRSLDEFDGMRVCVYSTQKCKTTQLDAFIEVNNRKNSLFWRGNRIWKVALFQRTFRLNLQSVFFFLLLLISSFVWCISARLRARTNSCICFCAIMYI